jgi:hypothetical protein
VVTSTWTPEGCLYDWDGGLAKLPGPHPLRWRASVAMADAMERGLVSADTENVLSIGGYQGGVRAEFPDRAMRLRPQACSVASVRTVRRDVRQGPMTAGYRDAFLGVRRAIPSPAASKISPPAPRMNCKGRS